MKTYTKQTTVIQPRLIIRYDDDARNPREDGDNLGYWITCDRKHQSPDEHAELEAIVKNTSEEADNQADHIRRIKKSVKNALSEKVLAVYPVVKYDHSGVSYSLGTAQGWDYSNNGFYIITDRTAKALGTAKKDFEQVIKQEIETYNSWINNEVYGFTLFNEQGEVIDSCWGFYDFEGIREHLPKEWAKENLNDYLIN